MIDPTDLNLSFSLSFTIVKWVHQDFKDNSIRFFFIWLILQIRVHYLKNRIRVHYLRNQIEFQPSLTCQDHLLLLVLKKNPQELYILVSPDHFMLTLTFVCWPERYKCYLGGGQVIFTHGSVVDILQHHFTTTENDTIKVLHFQDIH